MDISVILDTAVYAASCDIFSVINPLVICVAAKSVKDCRLQNLSHYLYLLVYLEHLKLVEIGTNIYESIEVVKFMENYYRVMCYRLNNFF